MIRPGRRVINTPSGRVAYRENGEGPDSVVLIHGSLVIANDMMIALAGRFPPRIKVVAMDRPGHGGSDPHPRDPGSTWAQAAMILDACRALGLRAPRLVGHSFGGAVALAAAMAEPEAVGGVVALAPICFPEPRLEQVLFGPRADSSGAGALARTLGAASDPFMLPLLRNAMFLPQAMPAAYAEAFPFAWASQPEQLLADGEDSMAMWRSLARSAGSYGRCRVPVRILGGTHDLVVNNAANGLLAAVAMPAATFRWVPGGWLHAAPLPPGLGERGGPKLRDGDGLSSRHAGERHSGMFPCFFHGFSSVLPRSMAKPRATRRRVEWGMITSST